MIRALLGQRGRVKLDVLRVHDLRAGALRHDHAVAERMPGVGGVKVDPADPARCEHREVCEDGDDFVRAVVEQVGADALVLEPVSHLDVFGVMVGRQKVDGGDFSRESDVRFASDAIEKGNLDRAPRRIGCVDDPRDRMRTFLGEVELSGVRLGEWHFDLVQQQLAHDPRALGRKKSNRFLVAEPCARLNDVFDEPLRRVVFTLVDDPALRPERIAVRRVSGLGNEQNLHSRTGKRKRRRQSGDARADDEGWIVGAVGDGGRHGFAGTEC